MAVKHTLDWEQTINRLFKAQSDLSFHRFLQAPAEEISAEIRAIAERPSVRERWRLIKGGAKSFTNTGGETLGLYKEDGTCSQLSLPIVYYP